MAANDESCSQGARETGARRPETIQRGCVNPGFAAYTVVFYPQTSSILTNGRTNKEVIHGVNRFDHKEVILDIRGQSVRPTP